MREQTFKDLLPEDVKNGQASPAVWAYIAELMKENEDLKDAKDNATNIVKSLTEQVEKYNALDDYQHKLMKENAELRNKVIQECMDKFNQMLIEDCGNLEIFDALNSLKTKP